MNPADPIRRILELARWAPSGDNTQPWQFEVAGPRHVVVHGRDTRHDTVYDLDGSASQLSIGAMLETLDIAASGFGLRVDILRRMDLPDNTPTFDLHFKSAPNRTPSDLIASIPARSVNRNRFSTGLVNEVDWRRLEASVAPEFELKHFSGWSARLRWARLLWVNAGLRLRLPEAFEVHRRVIQWNAKFSSDRIPDQALGASPGTLWVMRHAMTSWNRVRFLNTWLGGTVGPRLEMDLLPALACHAHIAILAKRPPESVDDHVTAGRAVQRFWLTVTQLGLQHQPALTPVVFARYAREQRLFTVEHGLMREAERIGTLLEQALSQGEAQRVVWLGRVGHGKVAAARSQRQPVVLRA